MEQSRKNYTFVLMSLIAAIVFVTYNVILFVICGFGDHGGSFWISFSFVVVAFIAFAVSGLLVQNATKRDENWVRGCSVLKYSAIYLAAEILISVAFVALDYVWDKAKEDRTAEKAIFIDETWQLIGAASNRLAAEFVLEIFKIIRGYGGSAICATQDLNDFV